MNLALLMLLADYIVDAVVKDAGLVAYHQVAQHLSYYVVIDERLYKCAENSLREVVAPKDHITVLW